MGCRYVDLAAPPRGRPPGPRGAGDCPRLRTAGAPGAGHRAECRRAHRRDRGGRGAQGAGRRARADAGGRGRPAPGGAVPGSDRHGCVAGAAHGRHACRGRGWAVVGPAAAGDLPRDEGGAGRRWHRRRAGAGDRPGGRAAARGRDPRAAHRRRGRAGRQGGERHGCPPVAAGRPADARRGVRRAGRPARGGAAGGRGAPGRGRDLADPGRQRRRHLVGEVRDPRAPRPPAARRPRAADVAAQARPERRRRRRARRHHDDRGPAVLERAARSRLHRAHRAPPDQPGRQGGRVPPQRRHAAGPPRPPTAAGRARVRAPGHRHPDLRRRGPAAGLRGGHPAGGAGRPVGPARSRPGATAALHRAAPGPLGPPRHLRRGGVRAPLRLVRHPSSARRGAGAEPPTWTTRSRSAAGTTGARTTPATT